MEKNIIFGAGLIGQRLGIQIKNSLEKTLLFFVDNDPERWNTTVHINGVDYSVLEPKAIVNAEYDKIHIAIKNAVDEVIAQCTTALQVPADKIDHSFVDGFVNNIAQQYLQCRDWFLESFAYLAEKQGIQGAVAEVGVYRGAYAKIINRCFPSRRLYLYDTFEGFDDRDIKQEASLCDGEEKENLVKWRESMNNFLNTSIEYVRSQMPFPQMCEFRKGYFPETFREEKETFVFVNLDCDLYNPIKAGLEIFYPRMERGGVILVHEYFDEISFIPGIKKAVDEFVKENDCICLPIGDKQSLAIVKK